jgi:hypothetical protein
MGASDVMEAARASCAARPAVLEQLEVVAETGEVRDSHVRIGNSRHHLHVVPFDLAIGDELEAELR